MDEQEMQVYQAGAFEAMGGYKQIDNGLSYFHLLSEQKWFPLGGTTKHKATLKVAKDSVKPVKAAMLGPIFVKIGPDTNGDFHYIGGDRDEHVGICDSRFAELVCCDRLERTTKNAKTGHRRLVTAEDQLVLNRGKDSACWCCGDEIFSRCALSTHATSHHGRGTRAPPGRV
jgi:hypothetical protein